MNPDILFHLLPRLTKDSFVYLYNQDNRILTKTNLDVLLDYYKDKVGILNIKRVTSIINYGIKTNRRIFVSECLENLPDYKKVNLYLQYRKYNSYDLPILRNIEENTRITNECKRLEFVSYNLFCRSM